MTSNNPVIRGARVFVAGHRGMVGSAVVRALGDRGPAEVLTATRDELDLRNGSDVLAWFEQNQPDLVFLVAGTVGGILANSKRQADFLYDNLLIATSAIDASLKSGVKKLLYLGSSCIYPRLADQPLREDSLLTGPLEPTNEGYAIAKIAGIRLCQFYRDQYGSNFISAMPTNLYGPNDNFDLEGSHVVPALLRKFHEARIANSAEVEIWGSGTPRREFLHVDDLAEACVALMENYNGRDHVNVGTGEDVTIAELAGTIRDIVRPDAQLVYDATKPDGMPRKVLDVSRIHDLGWHHRIDLRQGLAETYDWFQANVDHLRTSGHA